MPSTRVSFSESTVAAENFYWIEMMGRLRSGVSNGMTGEQQPPVADERAVAEAGERKLAAEAVAIYPATVVELIKRYRPKDIAIYGTSAGAILTMETVAALKQLRLPMPSALGVFSETVI